MIRVLILMKAPCANRDVANAESLGDHHVGLSFSTGKNDLRTLHYTVQQRAGMGDGQQFLFLSLRKPDVDWRAASA